MDFKNKFVNCLLVSRKFYEMETDVKEYFNPFIHKTRWFNYKIVPELTK